MKKPQEVVTKVKFCLIGTGITFVCIDMMVPEGGSAKLVCKSRGFPKPKITWKREDGREIIARNGPHGKTKCEFF